MNTNGGSIGGGGSRLVNYFDVKRLLLSHLVGPAKWLFISPLRLLIIPAGYAAYHVAKLGYKILHYWCTIWRYSHLPRPWLSKGDFFLAALTSKEKNRMKAICLDVTRKKDKPGQFNTVTYFGSSLDTTHIVSVMDLELFEHVLKNPSKFPRPPASIDLTAQTIGPSVITATGDKWRERRKALTPLFFFEALQSYNARIEENCSRLTEGLLQQADASPEAAAIVCNHDMRLERRDCRPLLSSFSSFSCYLSFSE
eukprot:GHVU01060213.1.p1 GENE.GHVU01060213.1~~GHVU01060213.1.p1  ORF type:complete len:254 (+),score=38.79 GHVU01060213.1:149-910(+)